MDLLERDISFNNRHPWELSRTECLIGVFHRVFPGTFNDVSKIADIGAGDRYFDLSMMKYFPKRDVKIYCIDANYTDGECGEDGIILGTDVNDLPDNSFDCIFMMDVMEHVRDDKVFLNNVSKKLKNNGVIIITVPAFQSLFSVHDEFLKHYRRYDINMLIKACYGTDMTFMSWQYFYTCLSLVRYVQIKLNLLSMDKETGVAQWKYSESALVTKIIKFCLNADFKLNTLLSKLGLHVPGLSLLAVFQKR